MGSLSRNDGYKNIIKIYDEMEKVLKQNKLWRDWGNTYVSYPIDFSSGLIIGSMRGTRLAENLFKEIKKYLMKFSKKDISDGGFLPRVFMESKNYDSFIERYDKLAYIEAQNVIAYNESRIQDLENQLAAVKNSRSYRLGQALTKPLRMLKIR
jgi:hypothetical protein